MKGKKGLTLANSEEKKPKPPENTITIEAAGHSVTMKQADFEEVARRAGKKGRKEKAPKDAVPTYGTGVSHGQVSALFKEAKLLRDKEGHQLVRADFLLIMNDDNAELLPKGIVAEWRGMKAEGLLKDIQLDGERLPVQVIEARMWPDNPKAKAFRAVNRMERVRLVEMEKDNTRWIELRVSIRRGNDSDTWDWLRANYPGSTVWLKFEQAQGELLEKWEEEQGED